LAQETQTKQKQTTKTMSNTLPHNSGVNQDIPEWKAVPDSYETLTVLLIYSIPVKVLSVIKEETHLCEREKIRFQLRNKKNLKIPKG